MIRTEPLLELDDRSLLMVCSRATHQHFKGGLYKLHGVVKDAKTGEPLVIDGKVQIAYEHVYPYASEFWVRDADEFLDTIPEERCPSGWPAARPRFRTLGSAHHDQSGSKAP